MKTKLLIVLTALVALFAYSCGPTPFEPQILLSGLSGSYADGKISLSWSGLNDVSGYYVYRSKKKNKGYEKVLTVEGAKTKAKDSKIKRGKKYYYKVSAFHEKGDVVEESKKSEVEYVLADLKSPDSFDAEYVSATPSMSLSWDAVNDASGYKIYRVEATINSHDGTVTKIGDYALLKKVNSGSTTSYDDTLDGDEKELETDMSTAYGSNVYIGKQFSYKIVAFDDGGDSAAYSELARSIGLPKPNGSAENSGPGQITVTWDAVSDATGYVVMYFQMEAPYTFEYDFSLFADPSADEITVSGLDPGAPYHFVVYAKDGYCVSKNAAGGLIAPPF